MTTDPSEVIINSVLINGKRYVPAPEPQPERAADLAEESVQLLHSGLRIMGHHKQGEWWFFSTTDNYDDREAIIRCLRHYARELVRRADHTFINGEAPTYTKFRDRILSQIKEPTP